MPNRSGRTSSGNHISGWCADVAVAYGAGVAAGSPLGLVTAWATRGRPDVILTSTILVFMLISLAVRRSRRARM